MDYQMPFVPFQRDKNSYVLPKLSRSSAAPAAPAFPIPPPELRLGYGRSTEEYLANGRRHVQSMLDLLRASGARLERGTRILDFGCGAGRMIRWLAEFSEQGEVWGTDISAEHIVWCMQYLTPPFHFLVNTTLPHVPFEDRYFDVVYAGSVFTHIDDLAQMWFLELRRVLRARGKLYVTIHDRHSIQLLTQEWREVPFAAYLRQNQDYAAFAHTNFAMFTIGRATESQVFYDVESLCEGLHGLFKVCSVTAVPCLQPALVHGDFHPYNILLRDDGSAEAVRQQLPCAESRKLRASRCRFATSIGTV
jgi:ubiquinone/menaquinone biosynthesis C-methylase UbiE